MGKLIDRIPGLCLDIKPRDVNKCSQSLAR